MRTKKEIREFNNIGKRLIFVKDKLGLTYKQISELCNIPLTNIKQLSVNGRWQNEIDYLYLSINLDAQWFNKYNGEYPSYKGKTLSKISVNWIQFGCDFGREAEIKELRETKKKNQKLVKELKNIIAGDKIRSLAIMKMIEGKE